MGFFRYPGGKSKFGRSIAAHLNLYARRTDLEYREPFFGGGSVGLQFLKDLPGWSKVWVNDKDIGIACLWQSVLDPSSALLERINSFVPSVEVFDEFKAFLLDLKEMPESPDLRTEIAFRKLAVHQTSYSGLGTKSGGPLGGREQSSKYKIDCRWSPATLTKKITQIRARLSRCQIKCTNLDFEDLVREPSPGLIYLDPPYYVMGNALYQCGFTEADHLRLSQALQESPHPWVLSYDDCPQVRELYQWASLETLDVNYSITAVKSEGSEKKTSRTKPELLVYSKAHKEWLQRVSEKSVLQLVASKL